MRHQRQRRWSQVDVGPLTRFSAGRMVEAVRCRQCATPPIVEKDSFARFREVNLHYTGYAGRYGDVCDSCAFSVGVGGNRGWTCYCGYKRACVGAYVDDQSGGHGDGGGCCIAYKNSQKAVTAVRLVPRDLGDLPWCL
ncbi:hypothetical protein M8818_003209 [Zalaria obscura]|uniref:Uncharacterized protein n=1 Tax=Zalaria obscura TaxID=2024903 RepID=A0ACC3SFC2_9PEZI